MLPGEFRRASVDGQKVSMRTAIGIAVTRERELHPNHVEHLERRVTTGAGAPHRRGPAPAPQRAGASATSPARIGSRPIEGGSARVVLSWSLKEPRATTERRGCELNRCKGSPSRTRMNHVPDARRSQMAKNLVSKAVTLAACGAIAAGLAACGSSPSKGTGSIPGVGTDANCASKPTTSSPAAGVKLDNYNHTCQGPAILSAYQAFISKFDAVFDDPFGNGDTPAQELGQIYQEILHGQYPQTSLPPGCTLNTSASVPQSLPAACQSLITSTTGNGPLAYATNELSTVATSNAVSEAIQVVQATLNAGTPFGSLTEREYAVVRQYGTASINDAVPDANSPTEWATYTSNPKLIPPAGRAQASVWSCGAETIGAKGAAGQAVQVTVPEFNSSAPWFGPGESWATTGTALVKEGNVWRVEGFFFETVNHSQAKGVPCGAGF